MRSRCRLHKGLDSLSKKDCMLHCRCCWRPACFLASLSVRIVPYGRVAMLDEVSLHTRSRQCLAQFPANLFRENSSCCAAIGSLLQSVGGPGHQALQSRGELLRRQGCNKISQKPQITERSLRGLNKTWKQVAISLEECQRVCQAASASSPCLIGWVLSVGNTGLSPARETLDQLTKLPCPGL